MQQRPLRWTNCDNSLRFPGLLFSDLMGALSQMLNQTEQTVLQVDNLDSTAQTKLDSVMSDTQKLEQTVQELLDQVEFMKNSDIRGEACIRCPLWAGFISVVFVFSSL